MSQILVEESALESIKAMNQRLQQERDMLLSSLQAMLHRDVSNTCIHETTHRGGSIWEICDDCGAKWADDMGGKPNWKDPKEWIDAQAIIERCATTPKVME